LHTLQVVQHERLNCTARGSRSPPGAGGGPRPTAGANEEIASARTAGTDRTLVDLTILQRDGRSSELPFCCTRGHSAILPPMPLHPNNQLLVTHLQGIAELDGRFTGITLVSYDTVADKKEGMLSLVFRALDKVEGKPVALKFYDLDPRFAGDLYRLECFARESDIVNGLVGVERCVQMVKPLTPYNFTVPVAGSGAIATLPCQYFALEWLDDRIDHYFLDQDKYQAVEKLLLFNEILLAVEALHRHGIFHRDLKADNLRASTINGKRFVVAIDLGTAARFSSSKLPSPAYPIGAVGAPAFASPESLCGLASSRVLAPLCDVYALGCLLFQLFHFDLYAKAVRQVNPDLDVRLFAMASMLPVGGTDGARVAAWQRGLANFSVGVNPVAIDTPGSSAPPGVVPLLGALLAGLTHIDFRQRPSLETARRKVWTAITVLRNEHLYQRKLKERRELRRRRLQKLAEKQQRLAKLGGPENKLC
jgi:serine/threonine protein kinase